MAWLQLHQSLPTHRKTLRMSDALGIAPVYALGHLASFWLWAIDNAPDGSLTGVSERTIARAAQFTGDPRVFLGAIVDAGFLEGSEDALVIHNWDEYAGRLIEKRTANAERMRHKRAMHVQNTCDARAGARVEKSRVEKNKETCRTSTKSSPAFIPESLPFQLASLLQTHMLQNNPHARIPKPDTVPFQAWCHHVDLMLRLDQRDPEQVRHVIDWCQQDQFWLRNILSPQKLRQQYDKLFLGWKASLLPRPGTNGKGAPNPSVEVSRAYDPDRDY